jgi:hypothetical protein
MDGSPRPFRLCQITILTPLCAVVHIESRWKTDYPRSFGTLTIYDPRSNHVPSPSNSDFYLW